MTLTNEQLVELGKLSLRDAHWSYSQTFRDPIIVNIPEVAQELLIKRKEAIEKDEQIREWRWLCKKYLDWTNGTPLAKLDSECRALLEKYRKVANT